MIGGAVAIERNGEVNEEPFWHEIPSNCISQMVAV